MSTFIHTADTHLGYTQYNRPERQADYLDAFQQVVDAAIENDVAGVIHAGDLFNTSRPGTAAIRGAVQQLNRLGDADIPFLAVVGNHDGTQDTDWIQIFSDMDLAVRLGDDPVVINDIAFYGQHYVAAARRDHLDYTFTPHDASHAVLVAHGLFDQLSSHGEWNVGDIIAQSPVKFDAALLGDDHTPKVRRWTDEEIVLTYAGSTERTAVTQRDDRVYNVVTVQHEQSGHTAFGIEQTPLTTRPHIYIETTLEPGQGAERIKTELDEHDVTDAVVATIIEGDDSEDISPAAIEQYARDHGALVARTSDRRKLKDLDVDYDVSFVDPDAAVREQLADMELSAAVAEVEEMVRDTAGPEAPAKTNLDALTKSTFRDRIDHEPEAFERTAEIESPDAATGLVPEESDTTSETERNGATTDSEQSTVQQTFKAIEDTETEAQSDMTD
ncbi:metallophosphoesterase family protein [Halocatena pleomorpha]|uniref:DNA double-strand break repair protein Mre11 n=1 Tax=Halocatena pleomorpha TaxID=1785090 RepID=A0A3P3R7J0_9EURY|nr:exonuclease SbcCD subunit D [Halocatena pleomorpha]RRJ29422.1 exonuclease SbcCD subunit D [Halocatena pleomorpha]